VPALRQIETQSYAKLSPPTSFGKPARLEWLAIAQLVIDPDYQRDITYVGRKNVRKIAEGFNWSMFAPVIVAPAGSNKFAIVDGQHRTTAAALCGVEKVPCAIIEAKPGEQAAAFTAINANTTALSSIQLHHAAVAAGDANARRINDVCRRGGVTVLRYPKAANFIAKGETMAVAVIGKCINQHGEGPVIAAFGAINAAGGGYPGNLQARVIVAFTEILAEQKTWRGPKLKAAVEEIYPDEMLQQARSKAAHTRGLSATQHLKSALQSHLVKFFGESKAA
jgi:hypothetical protein